MRSKRDRIKVPGRLWVVLFLIGLISGGFIGGWFGRPFVDARIATEGTIEDRIPKPLAGGVYPVELLMGPDGPMFVICYQEIWETETIEEAEEIRRLVSERSEY